MISRYRKICINAYGEIEQRSIHYVFPGNALNANLPPLLYADNWSGYANGTWGNVVVPPWTWLGAVGGQDSRDVVDSIDGIVNCSASVTGQSTQKISQSFASWNSAKASAATIRISPRSNVTGSGSQVVVLNIGGNYVELTCPSSNPTSWFLSVNGAFGAGVQIAQPDFASFYELKIAFDGKGNLGGYWNGKLVQSKTGISLTGNTLILECETATQNSVGNSLGMVLGAVKLFGYKM